MSQLTRRGFLRSTAATGLSLAAGPFLAGRAGAADAQPAGAPAASAGGGPKFKLGTVTYNVASQWDVPTLLRVCKNTGLAAVELRTTHKHGVEPSLTKDQRLTVKKQFADAGVVLWGLGSVAEFHSPDPAVVQRHIDDCKQFVELAADLGGTGVKVRPNALPKNATPEQTAKVLEQIGKALVPCGQAAADAGVEIWVEVHGPGTSHPPHVKTIMDHCGHPKVGVTWNSNPTDVKDGSVAEYFKLLRPHLLSCHINDLKKDAAGTYPYRELFRLLRETGYDRYTLCEVGTTIADPAAGEAFYKEYKARWTELNR